MPITTINTTLQNAVQSTISTFLQHRISTNNDLHSEVFRTIRDIANLLLEKQLVCEAFDKDPFELMTERPCHQHDLDLHHDHDHHHHHHYQDERQRQRQMGAGASEEWMDGKSSSDPDEQVVAEEKNIGNDNENMDDDLMEKAKNTELIARVKASLHVVSCARNATPEGYSSIHAVLQFNNDHNSNDEEDDDDSSGKMMLMQGVKNNVRLHFKFTREPQQQQQHPQPDHEDADSDYVDDDDLKIRLADFEHDDDDRRDTSSSEQGVSKNHILDVGQPRKKRKRAMSDTKSTINDKGRVEDVDESSIKYVSKNNCRFPVDTSSGNKKYTPKTIVTYKIDYSVDFGKMERLLGVDIYALDDYPSLEEAIPLMHEEIMEEPGGSNNAKKGVDDDDFIGNDTEFEEVHISHHESDDDDDENDDDSPSTENNDSNGGGGGGGGGDRFGVYINPENVVAFLDRMNLNLDDRSVFYFLLTFPFYEHEWDIPGFVLGALFDDEDDEDEEEEEYSKDCSCCLPCR